MQRYINGIQQYKKQTVPLRDSIGYYQEKTKKQPDQKIAFDVLNQSKQNNTFLKQSLYHIYDTLRKHQNKLDCQNKQIERLKRELDKVNRYNGYNNSQHINLKDQRIAVNKRDYEGLIQQNKELKQVIELMLSRIKQLEQMKGVQACTKLTLQKQSYPKNKNKLQQIDKIMHNQQQLRDSKIQN